MSFKRLIKNIGNIANTSNCKIPQRFKIDKIKSELISYNKSDWKKHINYFKRGENVNEFIYDRQDIYNDKNVDIVLIQYDPSAETKIHSHEAFKSCIIKVLDGKLEETVYHRLGSRHNYIYTKFTRSVHPQIQHKMRNISDDKSYSLNVYLK